MGDLNFGALTAALLAAFITAVLSGLGIGSAGVFVLYLTMFAGVGQIEAQGLNLIFFLFSAGAALLFHIRHRVIPRRVTLLLTVFAIPGALLGAWLAQVIDADIVRRLFGGMLIISGAWSLASV